MYVVDLCRLASIKWLVAQGWARTTDKRINSPAVTSDRSDDKSFYSSDLERRAKRSPIFVCTTVCTRPGPVAANSFLPSSSIGRISAAWPYLPPHVRDTILTLVDSIHSDQSRRSNAEQPRVQSKKVSKRTISGLAADKLGRSFLGEGDLKKMQAIHLLMRKFRFGASSIPSCGTSLRVVLGKSRPAARLIGLPRS